MKRVTIKKGKGVRETNSFGLHKPSSLYHRGVRLGWYQLELVLDDGSKVGEVLFEMQVLRMRFFY